MNGHELAQCLLTWIDEHTIETPEMDVVNVSELVDEINSLGDSDD